MGKTTVTELHPVVRQKDFDEKQGTHVKRYGLLNTAGWTETTLPLSALMECRRRGAQDTHPGTDSAGPALGMTQPTAGRHVAALEQALGVPLFTRSQLGLHAHRDYLAQQGTPQTLAELVGHSVIGNDQANAFIRSFTKSMPSFTRDSFGLRADSDLAELALIHSGAGLGFCQVALARRDPALQRALPEQFSLQLETWVTMHEDLRNSPRCRVSFDALVEGLQQHVAAAG